MKQYVYLSFSDPKKPKGERFIGGCYVLVDAPAIVSGEQLAAAAARTAWAFGCNPGGDMLMALVPYWDHHLVPKEHVNKLLSRKDLEELHGKEMVDQNGIALDAEVEESMLNGPIQGSHIHVSSRKPAKKKTFKKKSRKRGPF